MNQMAASECTATPPIDWYAYVRVECVVNGVQLVHAK